MWNGPRGRKRQLSLLGFSLSILVTCAFWYHERASEDVTQRQLAAIEPLPVGDDFNLPRILSYFKTVNPATCDFHTPVSPPPVHASYQLQRSLKPAPVTFWGDSGTRFRFILLQRNICLGLKLQLDWNSRKLPLDGQFCEARVY